VTLRRNAIRKGFLGGNRGWMAVGVAMYGPRLARRYLGKHPQRVATEKLRAGQFVRIEAIAPPTRKERKALKRAK
jgi:hypothetical protein